MALKSFMLWLAIFFNILTNIGFKYASMVTGNPIKKNSIFIGSLVFGLLNSICFTEALKTIPLNTASALFFSLTIVGLFLVAHFLFHDEMNWKHISGTFMIIAGVVLINMA